MTGRRHIPVIPNPVRRLVMPRILSRGMPQKRSFLLRLGSYPPVIASQRDARGACDAIPRLPVRTLARQSALFGSDNPQRDAREACDATPRLSTAARSPLCTRRPLRSRALSCIQGRVSPARRLPLRTKSAPGIPGGADAFLGFYITRCPGAAWRRRSSGSWRCWRPPPGCRAGRLPRRRHKPP